MAENGQGSQMHSIKYSVGACVLDYPKLISMSLKQIFFLQVMVLEGIMLLEFLTYLRIEQELLQTLLKNKILSED